VTDANIESELYAENVTPGGPPAPKQAISRRGPERKRFESRTEGFEQDDENTTAMRSEMPSDTYENSLEAVLTTPRYNESDTEDSLDLFKSAELDSDSRKRFFAESSSDLGKRFPVESSSDLGKLGLSLSPKRLPETPKSEANQRTPGRASAKTQSGSPNVRISRKRQDVTPKFDNVPSYRKKRESSVSDMRAIWESAAADAEARPKNRPKAKIRHSAEKGRRSTLSEREGMPSKHAKRSKKKKKAIPKFVATDNVESVDGTWVDKFGMEVCNVENNVCSFNTGDVQVLAWLNKNTIQCTIRGKKAYGNVVSQEQIVWNNSDVWTKTDDDSDSDFLPSDQGIESVLSSPSSQSSVWELDSKFMDVTFFHWGN